MLKTEAWTYETLAACSKKELEQILLTGTAPDPAELEGYIYCGWNHEWVGTLSGRKFKKGFRRREGRPFGFNEIVEQTGAAPTGEWKVRIKDGKHRPLGFFRVGLTADEPVDALNRPYRHTGHLNYNVPANNRSILNIPFKVIRDFAVLPNPGDHGLILCKAYFQLGPIRLFYCFFLLGHREKLSFEPW